MTKFRRDPKFTPASLTESQLARIEKLADAIVNRCNFKGATFSKTWQDAEDLASWWMNTCQMRQPSRDESAVQSPTTKAIRKQFDDDDTWRYLVGCILWVIACGLKSGKMTGASKVTNNRQYWAQVRGSY